MHASAIKAIFILLDAAARHWDYPENQAVFARKHPPDPQGKGSR